jgi:maleate isomerase
MADKTVRIGILTPHHAIGPEQELPDMAPGRISTRRALITAKETGPDPTPPPDLRILTRAPYLDDAADSFLREPVDAVGYASTSSAYAVGFAQETDMVSRLSQRIRIPVAATCASAVLALRMLGVQRLALVHPPWFTQELNELGAAYFGSQGFDVLASVSADLSQDPRRIESAGVLEWTSKHVPADADAIFIGGNGFRAAGAIEPLEALLGRPVLESNQVMLWNLLAQAGTTLEIRGYGQLFAQRLPLAPP